MSRELQLEEWSIMGGSRDLHDCRVQEHKGSLPGKEARGWESLGTGRKQHSQRVGAPKERGIDRKEFD